MVMVRFVELVCVCGGGVVWSGQQQFWKFLTFRIESSPTFFFFFFGGVCSGTHICFNGAVQLWCSVLEGLTWIYVLGPRSSLDCVVVMLLEDSKALLLSLVSYPPVHLNTYIILCLYILFFF